jgi:hypothetical protein
MEGSTGKLKVKSRSLLGMDSIVLLATEACSRPSS